MRSESRNHVKRMAAAVAAVILMLALCPALALAGEGDAAGLTAGTAAVDAVGGDGYAADGGEASVLEAQAGRPSLVNAKVSVPNVIYNGKAKKPEVTVKYNGKTLKAGTDYTVTYKNNVKVGTATATVKGKGRYVGVKTVKFKIFGEPSYNGATSMPVSSKAYWTAKNCTLKVVSGTGVLSVTGNVVTAKKAGVAKIGVYNKLGTRVATRSVTVYNLSGKYLMQSCMKGKSNMCLDMNGEGKGNGVQMIVWGMHGRANQQFTFEKQSDGSYMVKSVNSKKYLDVYGASKAWGQNVIQWQRNGDKNQRWRITVDASNRLTFVSVNSGLVFDVNGGKADWGARMIQWGSNGGLNQKWKLVRPPNYIVTTSEFSFNIPSYWRGKVYWVTGKNSEGRPVVKIYPKGMPANLNHQLASVQAVSKNSPDAKNSGDYSYHRACKVEKGSKAVIVWSRNWPAVQGYYYCGHGSNNGLNYNERSTLVDLSSGGRTSLAKVARNPRSYMGSFYDVDFLNKYLKPTIVVF